MAVTKPRLEGLVVGEYGKVQTITLKDFEGNAQDISSYTAYTIVCRSPEGTKTVTADASFTTDGTDGKLSWSFSTGSYIDRDGEWDCQVELTKTGHKSKTYPFIIPVEKSLR